MAADLPGGWSAAEELPRRRPWYYGIGSIIAVVLVVVGVEAATMVLVPLVAGGASELTQTLLDVGVLAVFSGLFIAVLAARHMRRDWQREADLVRQIAVSRSSAAELAAFFALSPDLMCVFSPDASRRNFNRAFTDVLGFTAEELSAMTLFDLIHPDDLEAAGKQFASVVAGATVAGIEVRTRNRDGTYRAMLWSGRIDPTTGLIFASAKDITEIRRYEADVTGLGRIVDGSSDVIAVFQPDGRISFLNEAARLTLGLSKPGESNDSIFDVFTADDRTTLESTILPLTLEGKQWTGELSVVDRTGRTTPLLASLARYPGLAGSPESVAIIGHDISTYKAAERAKDEFVAAVSHELRTPLASIRGSLSMIDSSDVEKLSPQAARLLAIAISNTERLTRLVDDIILLTETQAEPSGLRRVPVSLSSVAAEATAQVQDLAQQAGIDFVIHLGRTQPTVLADPSQLVRLLSALLDNAVKFAPGGSTVTVSVESGPNPGMATVSVADQGPGVPAEQLELIFQRFTQADSSTTRRRGGAGLGLAIAREIAEQHGGTLEVTSVPGDGSTFTLTMRTAPA